MHSGMGLHQEKLQVFIVDETGVLPEIPAEFRFAPGEDVLFDVQGLGFLENIPSPKRDCILLIACEREALEEGALLRLKKWAIYGPVVLCLTEENTQCELLLREHGVREILYESPPKLRNLCRTLYLAAQWQGGTSRARKAAQALIVLDRIPMGVIFVDQSMKVLHINSYGKRLRSEHRCFSVNDSGEIRFPSKQQTTMVANVVKTVVMNEPDEHPEENIYKISSEHGEYVLAVAEVSGDMGKRGAVLFLNRIEDALKVSASRLQSMYSLTEKEAELVLGLLQGDSLKTLADNRGVSHHTVRNQLKSVFAKTAVISQTGLVKKIMSTPSLFITD